jgi:hypothetical protein
MAFIDGLISVYRIIGIDINWFLLGQAVGTSLPLIVV